MGISKVLFHFFLSGSVGGKIESVTMENCDAEQFDRCEVSKGETVRGQLTFKASKATNKLYCESYAIFAGISFPFPGGCPVVDGCSSLTTGDCPIAVDETIVYNIEMFIDPSFPAVSTLCVF